MRTLIRGLASSLVFLTLSSASAADEIPRLGKTVSWTTEDGVDLVGQYQPAKSSGRPVWILLHGLGSNKQEWLGFARSLSDIGDGFLMYDARGHGESVRGAEDQPLDYREFRTKGPGSPWDRMVGDLDSAVRLLRSRFSVPARRIAVGGASLGANVALVYASQHPEVPAVILLSPGLDYAGVQTEDAFRQYGSRPIFLAASPRDTGAFNTIRKFAVQCPASNCTLQPGEGSEHGVAMLNATFTPKLLDWVKTK